ncbi:hypothetical protein [Leptospira johnsonii]|uniref:Uncharacterized protein n=1 Tax=Leptospira johnsonii TaxID=1917820 RepID=A0A2P2D5I8_9LEPT|nr:hypothetical protein [Leptospira johnsonii]GBF39801.1 hypothetical protein LPTSP1_28080 [Leptospira johnsonii]
MKEHLYKLTIFFSIISSSYCFIPQGYYEEKEKADPSKIYYKDAHILLFSAVTDLALRCETFTKSGFNYQVSYFSMMTDFCTEPHWEKGCLDYEYLNETDVYLCVTKVSLDQCDQTSDNPPAETEAARDYRFATFAICGNALRSKTTIPLFF